MIKWLIFDLGNTLYSHSIQVNAWKSTIKNDFPNFIKAYYSTDTKLPYEGGFSSKEKLRLTFSVLNNSEVPINEILLNYRSALRMEIDNFIQSSDVFQYLDSIKDEFNLGILSDNSIQTKLEWVKLFESNGYGNLFQFFIVSEEIQIAKPDLRAFNHILTLCTSPPKNITYFGDRLDKDQAARDVGMGFVHVDNPDAIIELITRSISQIISSDN